MLVSAWGTPASRARERALPPSVSLVLQHCPHLGPFLSPQGPFVTGPLIDTCAGLIPLQEMSLFPALRTYLGGVKVVSLILPFSGSSLKGCSHLGRPAREQLERAHSNQVLVSRPLSPQKVS